MLELGNFVITDLKGCQGGHDCLGTEGVLRVSMGCFIFHFFMCITTVGAKKLQCYRDSWHSGLWPVKLLLWISFMIIPFLFPPTVIQLYGEAARFGAGIFLLIQLFCVVKFITWWNDHWMSDDAGHCRAAAIMVSTTAYSASVCGIILMYIWYAPKASCSLNIFFVTWTLILLQIMTGISLHSKANAGLLASGLMGLYIVFLCWSAIRSEPITEKCNVRKEVPSKGDWMTIVSFVIAVFAIVMAAFSTGIRSRYFQFRKSDFLSDDDVPYDYGFFHFVFSMGSMYLAMLFVGWNLHQTMEKWSIDVGWASTWVKIVNEWLAASLYIWMQISPFLYNYGSSESIV
ncbi:uncharacterized protein LOC131042255 isoform X2 [Cryptomeria japonica]|uniref:uncharacterized protein LOC131042255 isoform X2 n=1 Tax=Cryptomeria japonica TaxID=3369 RepID=UPI0027DA62E8|nr:uncharacterized protein LOC131042255 isoform X2 [Cryptomeria japonica]